jgi:hypothetical protein
MLESNTLRPLSHLGLSRASASHTRSILKNLSDLLHRKEYGTWSLMRSGRWLRTGEELLAAWLSSPLNDKSAVRREVTEVPFCKNCGADCRSLAASSDPAQSNSDDVGDHPFERTNPSHLESAAPP